MESVRDFVRTNAVYLSVGTGVVGLSWLVMKRLTRRTRKCGVDYPKDTVILHMLPRLKQIPNLGHFVMKLETYLRITKIPYQVDFNYQKGPKSKVPWIEYNGMTMGDSHLIVQFLNKEFSVNLNEHLSSVETSQAWAIQKWIEEFTYWLNVYTKWVIFAQDTFSTILGFSRTKCFLFEYLLRPKMRKVSYTVGVGRHSNTEVHEMMENDIRHFATLLGNKKYLMGDKIAEVDCAAFGILSEVRWATPEKCPGRKLLLGQKNVIDYIDRIKNTYWPDWDDLEYSKKDIF